MPNIGKYVIPNNTSYGGAHSSSYELTRFGYGKNSVKVFYIERSGNVHSIREYEVDIKLRLNSQDDYLSGDNSHIVATDSQKNTVYVLARKHGLSSPEKFAILLCEHFIKIYDHIQEAKASVLDKPWQRLEAYNQPHNHAFVMVPSVKRFCTVTLTRNGIPEVISGLKDLQVLKTTQSAFQGFINDEFRTLPDASDRVFSTKVTASWKFNTSNNVDYDEIWMAVKDCILEKFAGPPNEGIYSPSVQNTLYLIEKLVLDKMDQLDYIEMSMPNKHYFPVDFTKFPMHLVGHVEAELPTVYTPVDNPCGIIHAALCRIEKARL